MSDGGNLVVSSITVPIRSGEQLSISFHKLGGGNYNGMPGKKCPHLVVMCVFLWYIGYEEEEKYSF